MDIVKSDKNPMDIGRFRKKTGLTPARKIINTAKTGLQLSAMFDITGSMFGYFHLVREKLGEVFTAINKEVSCPEFSVMAFRNHGDEKLHNNIYYSHPFTTDIARIRTFMSKINKGGGGDDALTCMEDCLKEANLLAWSSKTPKALIIVGDMPPHGVLDGVNKCPKDINYKFEIEGLRQKQIQIFSVFCGHISKVRKFYQEMAQSTKGRFLEIKEIGILTEILTGIAMKQTGNLDNYIKRLKKTKQLPQHTKKILRLLE